MGASHFCCLYDLPENAYASYAQLFFVSMESLPCGFYGVSIVSDGYFQSKMQTFMFSALKTTFQHPIK